MTKASIITPTKNRANHLILLHEIVLSQTHDDWEWIIHDNSPSPSPFFLNLNSPKIHYHHSNSSQTIGEKRNFLCQKATGDFIFHFDDDDYYSKDYLQKGIVELQKSDFFTLSSWFCAHVATKQFFYWDKESVGSSHFVLNPRDEISQRSFVFEHDGDKREFIEKNVFGYGFCYAYRKEVAKAIAFEKTNFDEDYLFFQKAKKLGFTSHSRQDVEGRVVHMMHDLNTTLSFPQYSVPSFMMYKFFPELSSYIDKYPGQ